MSTNNALLRLDDIHYEVDGVTILNGVNMNLNPGEMKLITGPSGCGKSTLLKIVASLISPTAGSILFEGKDINDITPEAYRQKVSYCSQTPALFGNTVYDNLAFPYLIRKAEPDRNRLTSDLRRFFLPESLLDKGVNELSGGEKQRVSLIRNLQFLPKVLLLDEITSALDEANKRNVNDIIHDYVHKENIAALWVTHDKGEIQHADDVITLAVHAGKAQEQKNERA